MISGSLYHNLAKPAIDNVAARHLNGEKLAQLIQSSTKKPDVLEAIKKEVGKEKDQFIAVNKGEFIEDEVNALGGTAIRGFERPWKVILDPLNPQHRSQLLEQPVRGANGGNFLSMASRNAKDNPSLAYLFITSHENPRQFIAASRQTLPGVTPMKPKPGIQTLLDSPVWKDSKPLTAEAKHELVDSMPGLQSKVALNRFIYGRQSAEHQTLLNKVVTDAVDGIAKINVEKLHTKTEALALHKNLTRLAHALEELGSNRLRLTPETAKAMQDSREPLQKVLQKFKAIPSQAPVEPTIDMKALHASLQPPLDRLSQMQPPPGLSQNVLDALSSISDIAKEFDLPVFEMPHFPKKDAA
jgi:hypothetical protein